MQAFCMKTDRPPFLRRQAGTAGVLPHRRPRGTGRRRPVRAPGRSATTCSARATSTTPTASRSGNRISTGPAPCSGQAGAENRRSP
ncbi:hypothetical protein LT493_10020 [Streptomyces tricolor]|nr:hypothetical protein [Streptomyces tricolor]